MNDIEQRIAALSPAQRALFEQRIKQKGLHSGGVSNKASVIPKRQTSDALPLSLAQERFWLMQQLESDIHLYNESNLFRLTGQLNSDALEKSLNEVIKRHEILRTNFQVLNGQPVQIIASHLSLNLPLIDLEKFPEADQEAKIQQIIQETSSRPFNLSQGSLLRVILLKIQPKEHLFLVIMHHILCDGWSMKVFFQELAIFYQAFSQNKLAVLPELPIQYADFALWQREKIARQEYVNHLSYWKQQLGGTLPVLELPTDYPRPAVQTFRGARTSLILSEKLTQALKCLSQGESVTLFVLLLTAFKILLYRYTGQLDLIVGTPISDRTQIETERLIGCMLNTLVLRTDLSGNPNFRQLLARVRDVTLGAYTHQALPFEQLVKELQPNRDRSHSPLFQVLFVFLEAPLLSLELPGLIMKPLMVDSGISKFDLTLYLEDSKQGLIGVVEYNTELLKSETIARMLGHFQILLEGIVANPEQSIANLPLLTSFEMRQFSEWNQTQSDYPEACMHELFEMQVERTPDAIAVVFEGETLTYRELNQKANQLAHYLRELGVSAEQLVGICVERSRSMIVALLAILKAGGVYVPLDPEYPSERLAFMVEDARLSLLLTQQKLADKLPANKAKKVYLDSNVWKTYSTTNPTNLVTPNNLVYTIYTSGSTGKPKGVLIPHGALTNCLIAFSQKLGLSGGDTFLSVTTLSFDIAALELYLPLILGERLIIASREVATDGTQLLKLIQSSAATVIQATPATWYMLLAAGWEGKQPLKILCGGEALSRELANQLLERCDALWNVYGPTETTIWSAAYQVELGEDAIPIGRPIANTQFYILDQHLQPVPIGVPGELYIGGAGLAVGYLNRPELTAERFISNPLSISTINSKLYKTGDLVRYLPDGNLEYLGRIDHQIKLRGFRIELGEIEQILSQHPALQQAVVVAREDKSGDKRLVAYVVTNEEESSLRLHLLLHDFLAEKLPFYMIPSAFVVLEALPLTPNGKVDRKNLPAPDFTQIQLKESAVIPLTPIQEVLAGIWQQVLGIEQIGINENFFELGGHSLLATRVISQIRSIFKVDLPLRSLFELPTISKLSQSIETATKTGLGLDSLPIQRVNRESELPLSFAQARLWFIDQLDPGNSSYNLFAAVRLTGEFNWSILEQCLNEVIRRHEVLRTNFIEVNGQTFQVISLKLTLTIPVIKVHQRQEIQELAIAEANKPFNLNQDPLLRLSFLEIDPTEGVLLLTMHHIISDGWSMGLLLQEITKLYQVFSLKQPSPLPELPIQYADFAVWQRQWLQGEMLQIQLNYWQQQLGHNLPTLNLLTDRPRPTVQSLRGAKKTLILSQELSKNLKDLSTSFGSTLFMILLAVFKVLLHYLSGQNDIVVGTDVANRNRCETEGLIGFFVNQLVLRTDVSGNPSFPDLLARIRQITLDAYAHQDLPFDKLVEALNPERDLSRTPLFQVKFVLQNAPMPPLEFAGLNLQPLDVDKGTSRFDLLLNMAEMERGLVAFLEYNTDLFNESTIARFLSHFEMLLDRVVSNPDIQLNVLKEFLAAADEQQRNVKEEVYQESVRQKLMRVKRKSVTNGFV